MKKQVGHKINPPVKKKPTKRCGRLKRTEYRPVRVDVDEAAALEDVVDDDDGVEEAPAASDLRSDSGEQNGGTGSRPQPSGSPRT